MEKLDLTKIKKAIVIAESEEKFDPAKMVRIRIVDHVAHVDRAVWYFKNGYKCYKILVMLVNDMDGHPKHQIVMIMGKPQKESG